MPRCIGIIKKGTQCTNNATYGRGCGMHGAQALVARPDITEGPAEVPPRKAKLDPYYITGCQVFECERENMFGDFVCVIHYDKRFSVSEGIADEKRRFTPYYQQLLHQCINNPNHSNQEFQTRITENKEQNRLIGNAWAIPNTRQIDPFYLTECQHHGCTTVNRFGRFTCLAHKPQETNIKTRFDNEANECSLHYRTLKYRELTDPRRTDAAFQERIRRNKQEREARRQQRNAQERQNEVVELARRALNQPLLRPVIAQVHEMQNVQELLGQVMGVAIAPIPQQQREDEQGRWIFERDPEGGVNLRALANDNQSVHRSSVQEDTIKNIELIMKVPLIEPMLEDVWDTHYVEFLMAIDDAKLFTQEQYDRIRQVFANEANQDVASFNTRFVDLFGHIWSYIKPHNDSNEMMKRLGEELMDCRGMCSNGKIARLVNALQGFMEGLSMPVDKMEVFQGKFAKLMEMPKMKRVVAALDLFKEYEIPEDKQEDWFMPLVEA
jgi:hypothetical protein